MRESVELAKNESEDTEDTSIEILLEDGESQEMPSSQNKLSVAYSKALALCGLVAVQVLVGVASKLAVTGKSASHFSPASLLIVTESLKFCMSWATHASQVWHGSLTTAFSHSLMELYHFLPSVAIPYGVLGFAYAFNNNLGWLIYRRADLTSIATVRSGAILVSAVFSVLLLKRRVTMVQWAGMIGQTAGVFIAQVDACEGQPRLAMSTYGMLFILLVVSCLSAVWNEKLVKGLTAPLAIQQMSLYGFGTVFNLIIYFANHSMATGGGNFFEGWSGWTVVSALCYAFMGLAVIAALKYGDSIVKAMAGPITAICITLIDVGLLGTTMSTTAMVATVPIFMGSFIYIAETGRSK